MKEIRVRTAEFSLSTWITKRTGSTILGDRFPEHSAYALINRIHARSMVGKKDTCRPLCLSRSHGWFHRVRCDIDWKPKASEKKDRRRRSKREIIKHGYIITTYATLLVF